MGSGNGKGKKRDGIPDKSRKEERKGNITNMANPKGRGVGGWEW